MKGFLTPGEWWTYKRKFPWAVGTVRRPSHLTEYDFSIVIIPQLMTSIHQISICHKTSEMWEQRYFNAKV